MCTLTLSSCPNVYSEIFPCFLVFSFSFSTPYFFLVHVLTRLVAKVSFLYLSMSSFFVAKTMYSTQAATVVLHDVHMSTCMHPI
eukprot:m.275838 g.275838  ORF g.275838 m.275838 type:complete len:84 (-) comp15700_c2_seq11:1072-1323(-)